MLQKIETSAFFGFTALLIAGVFLLFSILEPVALRAQDTTYDVIITQTITGETSFTATTSPVAMDTAIASITGGTSNATTSFTVLSNSSNGYNVTLSFSDDPAMQLNGGGASIPNYTNDLDADDPDYGFQANGSGQAAQFGISVYNAASSTIVAQRFRDDGASDCGSGTSNQYGQCWSPGSTTPEVIINSSSPTTGGGDTSNLLYRVHVPANASPAVPAGTYTATATLTVAENT